jgi:hypothetical protein
MFAASAAAQAAADDPLKEAEDIVKSAGPPPGTISSVELLRPIPKVAPLGGTTWVGTSDNDIHKVYTKIVLSFNRDGTADWIDYLSLGPSRFGESAAPGAAGGAIYRGVKKTWSQREDDVRARFSYDSVTFFSSVSRETKAGTTVEFTGKVSGDTLRGSFSNGVSVNMRQQR